jgi:hypothetical protein
MRKYPVRGETLKEIQFLFPNFTCQEHQKLGTLSFNATDMPITETKHNVRYFFVADNKPKPTMH